MGLPMIQVAMILMRQMSKPVADLVMRYGRDHPSFRNKVLIPVGKGIVNLSTRMRMKNLGLGTPKSISNVSEATALEQASDFIQQVVIFGYSVTVVYFYYAYTKSNEKAMATEEGLLQMKDEMNTSLQELQQRIEVLENEAKNKPKGWLGRSSSAPSNAQPQTPPSQVVKKPSGSERKASTSMSQGDAMRRISQDTLSSSE